jgi:hypothetical protein
MRLRIFGIIAGWCYAAGLMVHVFYPAASTATVEGAVYLPDADELRDSWNDAQLTRIKATWPGVSVMPFMSTGATDDGQEFLWAVVNALSGAGAAK